MRASLGKVEKFPECPANPEVLLDTRRRKSEHRLSLVAVGPTLVFGEPYEGIHNSYLSRFGDLSHDRRDPRRSVGEVAQQLFLLIVRKPSLQRAHYGVVNVPPSEVA